ncbi:hypothetical protein CRP01_40385 [Flavilitoribacter nigricans DSM 23189 = NBRC 102662]|uniref:Uncharacterized protein n=1 Tax=Flavilitoribacter nigricans (strain ATCC 23147 / DSM 23189 / NBRC 102662 / NCIMB 1420 / SS-2) TaxID=1122177 RepID=A0A2D0MWZ2_FLAN2|nr:hypothetical protein CRP01_40385 [Flavilitoribacter nigricans DSM 23189 = NBRC 102662]
MSLETAKGFEKFANANFLEESNCKTLRLAVKKKKWPVLFLPIRMSCYLVYFRKAAAIVISSAR